MIGTTYTEGFPRVHTGLIKLAGDFPPSVNTTDDVSKLKVYESPACYGVDCKRDGLLKLGTIITGQPRLYHTVTLGNSTTLVNYAWYYDRMWAIGAAATDLVHGAKFYNDIYQVQGRGKVTAEDSIVAFMPCLRSEMWIATASGSQFIRNATAPSGQFYLDHLIQEFFISAGKGGSAITIDEIPYVVNTKGIFSYNGSALTEITRPVRYSLGSFGQEVTLTADYQQKFLIGGSSFVVDVTNGKLFDYGTSGFLFTSRTITGDNYRPFGIGDISFSIQFDPATLQDGIIKWQSQAEDGVWVDEPDLNVVCGNGANTLVQVRPQNVVTNAHKFTIRIISLPANIYIREISMNVIGLAQGSFSQ